jgi:penicillin-binding protein 1B
MRVWSGIFTRLPSAPLKVSDKGMDWQWVVGDNATDATCAGARQFPFVAGYAPAYSACVAEPSAEEEGGGGWRSWFGLPPKKDEAEQEASTPAQETP